MTEIQVSKITATVFLLCVINAAFQTIRMKYRNEHWLLYFAGYLGLGTACAVLTALILAAINIIFL